MADTIGGADVDDNLFVEIAYGAEETVVTVRGEIDLASSLALQTALDVLDGERHVVVDCFDVHFMDSSGVRTLLVAQMRLATSGGSLHIRRPSVPVRLVMQTCGLENLLVEDNS